MEVNGAAAMRRSSGSPAHDGQAHASWRSSSSASGAAGSLSNTSSASGAAGRLSTASGISCSPVAARKRLSTVDGTGPPPSAVAPYLAGPAVASFVSKRTTQKAELMQYLGAHSGSVRAMLNSGDGTTGSAAAAQQHQQLAFDGCWSSEGQLPLSGSPCTAVSSAAGSGSFFGSCSSQRASQLPSPAAAAAAAAAAGDVSPSSARRASVSAYLQGKQDLATTVSAGVPYLDSSGSSPRAARAFDAAAAAAAEGSGAVPAASSSSRHTIIKEALHARLGDAAARASYAGSGGSSPRMHDEVAGIRQSLLAEGRARRASTAAVAGSSSSSAASQAAAMIARRLSNMTIYPGAYDAAAALDSSAIGIEAESNSQCSGFASLQQSWEAENLASLSEDEQGRVKVGFYGSFVAAPGTGSTLITMPLAGMDFAGNLAGTQQGGLAGPGRSGGGGGKGKADGGSGSRRSSGSSGRSSSDGSEGDGDSSSDDDDNAAGGYGMKPAAAARQKPRVSSKRGGWRANERLAAKGRASISSSGGARDSRSSTVMRRTSSMNGRATRHSLLQQPHTTRAVSKPERQATASLAKAAAARRSSIGVSRQSLLQHGPSRQQGVGRVNVNSSGSSRRSSDSSDAKTDVFELTARSRRSINTGKGFLGSLPTQSRPSSTGSSSSSSSSSSGSDSDSDTGSDNGNTRLTKRTTLPVRRSSSSAVAGCTGAAAAGRKKSQVIRRKLLLQLRNARSSSSSGSSSNRSSTSDGGEAAAGRRKLVKQRSSIKYRGASRYSRGSSMKRLSSGPAAAAAAAGRRSSFSAAAAAASRASAAGIGTHMCHSARISDAARLRAAASSSGSGSTGSSGSGGRRLGNALEVFLNPDDKPTHRLSCSAGNAAAVLLGAASSSSTNDEADEGWQSDRGNSEDGAAAAACRRGRDSQAIQQQQQQGGGDGRSRPGLRKSWSKVYRTAARSSVVAAPHAASVRLQRVSSNGRAAAGAGAARASMRRDSVATAQQHTARRSSSGGLQVGGGGSGGDAGREADWVASVVRRLSGVAPGAM